MTPVLGHAPDLIRAGNAIAVQEFVAAGPAEAFEASVMGRLARRDVQQFATVALCPLLQSGADEHRAIVQAQALGRLASLRQLTP